AAYRWATSGQYGWHAASTPATSDARQPSGCAASIRTKPDGEWRQAYGAAPDPMTDASLWARSRTPGRPHHCIGPYWSPRATDKRKTALRWPADQAHPEFPAHARVPAAWAGMLPARRAGHKTP